MNCSAENQGMLMIDALMPSYQRKSQERGNPLRYHSHKTNTFFRLDGCIVDDKR